MDREITDFMMEALISGQYNKVTRVDTSTGIFASPKLLYASDEEDADNLVMNGVQDNNRQNEVNRPLDQPIDQPRARNPRSNPQNIYEK